LIVRPLYRLRRIIEGGTRDALFGSRLRRATRDLGDLPSRDIREAGEEATPVILIHGLASTGVDLAREIEPLRIPTLRFEHDTFMSISRNAQDLGGFCAHDRRDLCRLNASA